MITDPPYGFGHYYYDDERGVVESLNPYVRKAIFGYPEILCRWCRTLGEPNEWITWWPTNKQTGRTAGLSRESEAIAIWGPLFELPLRPRSADPTCAEISIARGLSATECKDGDVWRDAAPGMGFNGPLRLHPNEKPYSLMCKLVRLCTSQGETIVDPYAGSGTTLLAAKNLHRKAIGIEIDEQYCEIATNRLRQEVLAFA